MIKFIISVSLCEDDCFCPMEEFLGSSFQSCVYLYIGLFAFLGLTPWLQGSCSIFFVSTIIDFVYLYWITKVLTLLLRIRLINQNINKKFAYIHPFGTLAPNSAYHGVSEDVPIDLET